MTNFKYLFVVGAAPSGTTWLHQLLLSHPDAIGGQESHFFATFGRVLHDFDHKLHQHRPHGLAGYCRRDELIEHIRNHWAELTGPFAEFKPGATLFVDKTPDHAVWLDAIAEILPEARVLHMHRDARAVVASFCGHHDKTGDADGLPAVLRRRQRVGWNTCKRRRLLASDIRSGLPGVPTKPCNQILSIPFVNCCRWLACR